MAADSFDFLSNILQGIQLHQGVVEEATFHESWSVRNDGFPLHFYYLSRGECQLKMDCLESVVMNAGDLMVILRDCDKCFHCNPHRQIAPFKHFSDSKKKRSNVGSASNGLDGPNILVCGRFHFKKPGEIELLNLLPPFIQLKGVDGKAAPWLDGTLKLILDESTLSQPGRQAIVDHLAQIIFIEAIRSCLKTLPIKNSSWLMGLLDPDIGPVLELMHAQPEFPWTVASLAKRVCLSRSVFAARFKSVLLKTPFQYLLECRMQKACTLLSEGRDGIKKIASLSGYATEAAFSNAFKRWSGKTPGAFRRIAHGCGESPQDTLGHLSHDCETKAHVRQNAMPN
jgi:AraC-like DNA-binding protein